MTPTLHPALFTFLDVVAEKNSREFFATVKPLYQEIHQSVIDLCAYLIKEVDIRDTNGVLLDPKKCLYRIYRDARRLKEGDQLYKHHFSFMLNPDGKNAMSSGYYVHIQPGNSFFACGIYRSSAAYLKPLREKLQNYGNEYNALVSESGFVNRFGQVEGSSLARPPKGFDADASYIELIKRKQHLITAPYSDVQVLQEDFAQRVLADIHLAQQWNEWLRE